MYQLGCLTDLLPAVPHLAAQGGRLAGVQPGEAAVGVPRQDGQGFEQGGSDDPVGRRADTEVPRLGARPRGRGAADDRAPVDGPLGTAGLGRRRLTSQAASSHLPRVGTGPLRRDVRAPVQRARALARRLPDSRRGRAAPEGRRQSAVRRTSTWETRQRCTSCSRRAPMPTSTSTWNWVRGSAVRGHGPAGFDGERRHRGASLHRRLELLAGRHAGPDACRRWRGPEIIQMFGRYVRLKALEDEPEAARRERCRAAAGQRQFTDPFAYMLSVVRDGMRRDAPIDLPETFNYLIGLRVESRHRIDGVLALAGTDAERLNCLVLWRAESQRHGPHRP